MPKRSFLIAAAIALASAMPTGATESDAVVSSCGHLEELAAAKRALEEGRTAQALRHLRNADALLSRCQRYEEPLGHDVARERRTADVGRAGALPTSMGRATGIA